MPSNFLVAAALAMSLGAAAQAEQITVQHVQSPMHRFMVTRSESGAMIARHEFSQTAQGDEVTMHMAYYFVDGSIDDEVTTYRQQGTFRLVRDHHLQKGPFFTKPLDYTVEAATGRVTIRTTDKSGVTHAESRQIALPDDLANGLVGVLLLNTPHDARPFRVGMLAPVGGGRLIQILISPQGEQSFQMAGQYRTATMFRIHPELGGIVGFIASLIGVQPKDVLVWVAQGADPAVVKIVGQLGGYGPVVTSCLDGTGFRN